MSSFKVQGTIKVIGATTQVSEKFSKRDLVLTVTDGVYPQDIQFQLTQDKCSVLDAFNVGNQVEVSFNIRGKGYANKTTGEVKYYNSLECWRIENVGVATQAPQAPQAVRPTPHQSQFDRPAETPMDNSEMPF